ncbi:MAG: DNA repair protein RecN, partial [Clostridia bacterium]|nr:DNA repair protein RecN [Clostridia bacterium]
KEIAANLINLHTQHQSQTLMNDENHISYLDSFTSIDDDLAAYKELYDIACEKEKDIAKLKKSEQEKARATEMLKFQIEDIKQVSPKDGEEEELTELASKIRNAEAISKHVRLITRALYKNDKGMSASDMMEKASEAIDSLSDILPEASEYSSQLEDMRLKLEDIADTVNRKCSVDVENPTAQLDRIETRLDSIDKLKRKYGSTIKEILDFKVNAELQLKNIETADEQIEDIKNELKGIYSKLKVAAENITEKSRTAADVLEKKIMNELSALEMEKVQFKIDITRLQSYSPIGIDSVTFLVSTNPGEPLLPLSKIASGGELSRMMLALKCALADKERTPTLIFDEIDTGISGKTSHKIGLKLRSCSETCQVLCVTHSPQIAAVAYEHMLVSKHETNDGRTESGVRVLLPDERVTEISRIIGGEKITEKTIIAAKEMLEAASK